jgi:murein DD-endopeptidase MepM/ murein hydrolase activator NlpD
MTLTPPLARASIVCVTQRFNSPSHMGIDYSCIEGTPIYAAADGVAYRGSQPSGVGVPPA